MGNPSTRWLIGAASGIAVLVIVSIIIAVAGHGKASLLPETTPEGVVQRFLNAVEAQDYSQAHVYLSSRLQNTCTITYIRETLRWREQDSHELRAEVLGKDAIENGRTQVRVRIVEVRVSPPLGVNESSHDELYILAQEAGSWRIDEPPWPVSYCPESRRNL